MWDGTVKTQKQVGEGSLTLWVHDLRRRNVDSSQGIEENPSDLIKISYDEHVEYTMNKVRQNKYSDTNILTERYDLTLEKILFPVQNKEKTGR